MKVTTRPVSTPARPRLLLVEDSVFIAMALESVCKDLGWDIVGPAVTLAQGIALAQAGQHDAALLDVSLGEERCWPIAALLQARGTPFALASGHDLAGQTPPEFARVPVYRKPFRLAELERALLHMMASRTPVAQGPET